MKTGKTWPKPEGATNLKTFRIYRWNPDDGKNPQVDTYFVDLDTCGPMVLDALIKIKNEIDPTLTFRRSCREGICGSCAMNIGGKGGGVNTLACIYGIDEIAGDIAIYPLPHMPVVKDLIPDLTHFYAQHAAGHAVARDERPAGPRKEWRQSIDDRQKLDGLYECVMCACCSTACPTYWWNGDRYPRGPPPFSTPIAGSSTAATRRRASGSTNLEDPFKLYRCHTIMNCAKDLSEGSEPRQGDPGNQETHGRAGGLRLPSPGAAQAKAASSAISHHVSERALPVFPPGAHRRSGGGR